MEKVSMSWLSMIGWGVLVGLLLVGLDRLARWMEDRGWIYYRKSGGNSTRMGNAFLELQSMFEPGRKHVIVARQEARKKTDDSGESSTTGEENLSTSGSPL
jgi:hypothetical protein